MQDAQTQTRYSTEELLRAEELHKRGRSWTEIAGSDKESGERLRCAVRRRIRHGSFPVPDELSEEIGSDIEERIQAEREKIQKKGEEQPKKERAVRMAYREELLETLAREVKAIAVPRAVAHPRRGKPKDEEPVLLLGDMHLGQGHEGRVAGGYEQSSKITREQLDMLRDEIYALWRLYHAELGWRRFHLLGLGDLVEGSHMRVSQIPTVDKYAAAQAVELGEMLSEFIASLLTFFESGEAITVPGNHGRFSEKAGNGGLDELDPGESFDWMGCEIARLVLRDAVRDGRISFVNHRAVSASHTILGNRVFLEHGSSMRGSGGLGNVPSVVQKLATAYLIEEGEFDLLALGHWHQPYEFTTAYKSFVVGNGAFPPTTPYIWAAKHRAIRPSQTLLSLCPNEGVTFRHLINLERRDAYARTS